MTRKEFIEEKFPNFKKDFVNNLNKSPVKDLQKNFNKNPNFDMNILIEHFDNMSNMLSILQYYYILYTSIYRDNYEPNKELVKKAIEFFKELEEYENCDYIKKYFKL